MSTIETPVLAGSSGSNTGDVTLATVGSTPANAGASLSAQVLTLQPADATHGGVVSTAAQTMAGVKTFSSAPVMSGASITSGTVPGAALTDAGVTLAKQANLAANSIQGNNTGSAAVPLALTVAQTQTLLNAFAPGAITAFTSSGTFTTPSDGTTSTVYGYRAVGGGGGGGGCNGAAACAAGGGSGAYVEGTFTGVAASTGITITIGAAGTAGSAAGGNGGAGGGTILGSPVSITAGGGGGGTGATLAGNIAGGAGGTVTGSPSVSLAGTTGSWAFPGQMGGSGAGSSFGSGAQGGGPNTGVGSDSTTVGAGGGGGAGLTATGGAGFKGIAIITRLTP